MRYLKFLGTLCLALGTANPAWAESHTPMQQAELAYREVDFERTRDRAKEALERGAHKPRDTERLYFLLAMSSAALGEEDAARAAFTSLLGINPEARVEKNLSPKLRGPYAEALGFWKSIDEKLDARSSLSADQSELVIEVTDPGNMVSGLAVRSRRTGEPYSVAKFKVVKGEPVIVGFANEGAPQAFEVVLLDEHGNALRSVGSTSRPLDLPQRLAQPRDGDARADRNAPEPQSSSSRWLGGIVLGLGTVGVGAAVPFHLDREDRARQWNSSECEGQLGLSRGEQCARTESEMEKSEQRMLILYGAGGALMAGGLLTLLLSAPASEQPAVSQFGCSVAMQSVQCSARF